MDDDQKIPPPGPPTAPGWMLSCSGVHPEAVRIVEAYQAEVERLREENAILRSQLSNPELDRWATDGT